MDEARRRARVGAISSEMASRGLAHHDHYAARAATHDGVFWALLDWDRARHQGDDLSRVLIESRLLMRYGPGTEPTTLEDEIGSLREALSRWVRSDALERIAAAARTKRHVLFLLQDAEATDTPGDLEEAVDAIRRHVELPEDALGGPGWEELEADYADDDAL